MAGLGGAQFAIPGAVDRMRGLSQPSPSPEWTTPVPADGTADRVASPTAPWCWQRPTRRTPTVAALPWPDREQPGGHALAEKAGALVVLVDGALVLYVERGGRSLLTFTDVDNLLAPAVDALALAVREGHLGRLTVERADGETLLSADLPLAQAFQGSRLPRHPPRPAPTRMTDSDADA